MPIGRHGTYQDGGMRNPNPTDIAMEEVPEVFGSRTRYDLVLSLGTGLPPLTTSPGDTGFRSLLIDCSGLRVMRWSHERLRETVDAETVHQKILRMFNASEPASIARYHRLNLDLPNGLPSLDDTTSMDSLMAGVEHCRDVSKLSEVKMALIASSFYFELDRSPAYGRDGRCRCSGTIHIRGNPEHVCELVRTVQTGRIRFAKSDEDIAELHLAEKQCIFCKRFSLPIAFVVPQLDTNITLSIRLGAGQEHHISGFPQTMEWFITQQRLDDPFSRSYSPAEACVCRQAKADMTRKRTNSTRTVSTASKRRRTRVEQSA